MKLSQKKTCEGCRALSGGQGVSSGICELGFNNAGPMRKIVMGKHSTTLRDFVPQEPCYKPRTISELFEAQRLIQIERNRAA